MSATAGREHRRSDGKLPIIELFGPTVQGEGRLCGSVSHFIRFGGCDFRCSWCDSMHAVDPDSVHKNATWLSPVEIAIKVNNLPKSPTITLSGGNPALWDLSELIDLLAPQYYLAVETQGSIWQDWMLDIDLLTISPKGPSSGMFKQLDWNLLDKFNEIDKDCAGWSEVVFKVVVFNEEDFSFAKEVRSRYKDIIMYLSSGTPVYRHMSPDLPNESQLIEEILHSYRNLCERVLKDPDMNTCTVLPQIHQLIWPGQLGK